MSRDLSFEIEAVFEIPDRGLILYGLTESQWDVVQHGDIVEVRNSHGRHSHHTVTGIEYPTWIEKPVDPRYGVLVTRGVVEDKEALIGAHAIIAQSD